MAFEAKVLSGKNALVTGASRGIGAAIAKRLARDGANVAITYSSSKPKADEVVREIQSMGVKGTAILADSANAEMLIKAVDDAAKTFGGLDILVNNAGIGAFHPIGEFPLDEFDRLMAVNVRAVFVASKAASRHMREGGRIITIGSTNAERMPFAGGSVYALSKAAVAGFTRGLARDLGPRGITVNNIQPGPVDTDLNPKDGPNAEGLKALMALPRYGHVEEIASFTAYLAGAEAAFITGASLMIDGGFSA